MSEQTSKPILVSIIIGSQSDAEIMQNCTRYLDYFKIGYELKVLSAHRNPKALSEYLSTLTAHGVQVVIAAAGMAAHLPGAVAAQISLPVIGVPLAAAELQGLDSLLAIVQMPSGIPVATVAIGKAGAVNAAVLAVEILALANPQLRERLQTFRENGAKL